MPAPTLTIFANFRINDQERFCRMRDSFLSFEDIDAQRWVINVRGKYNLETLFFLHDHLGEKLSAHVLEGRKGWFNDTRQLLEEIDTDFVLFWIEDHLNLVDVVIYDGILKEMAESKSEYLNYTWWFLGHSAKLYDGIPKKEYKHIEAFVLNENNAKNLSLLGRTPYLISIPSIFSTKLFKKIASKNDPRFRRWPKETPFDFEKKGTDYHWLPINMAISKAELFACIDDDQGISGYSLQSRGLYPQRVTREREKNDVRHAGLMRRIFRKILPKFIKTLLLRLSYYC